MDRGQTIQNHILQSVLHLRISVKAKLVGKHELEKVSESKMEKEEHNASAVQKSEKDKQEAFEISEEKTATDGKRFYCTMAASYVGKTKKKDNSYYYMVTSDNHVESYTALQTLLNDNGFNAKNLYDVAEQEESERNIVTIIRVFSYGFIVLISLIAAANVFACHSSQSVMMPVLISGSLEKWSTGSVSSSLYP